MSLNTINCKSILFVAGRAIAGCLPRSASDEIKAGRLSVGKLEAEAVGTAVCQAPRKFLAVGAAVE